MAMEETFPAFGLRIACGPLVMRPVRERDVTQINHLVAQGIHAENARPFLVPWNLGDNQPLESLQFFYRAWGTFTPESWRLPLAVERDGVIVGVQDVFAENFPTTRVAETGSWLTRSQQGRGTGTLMRQAILQFAFDHMGAVAMTSGAWSDNHTSRRVSEKCGYILKGTEIRDRQGVMLPIDEFIVTSDTVVRPPHDVRVEGVEPFLRQIGISDNKSNTT